ncbi:MAG: hypothetical protein ACO214_00890 [Hylemonella sp.]|jgi:hypothetical protein
MNDELKKRRAEKWAWILIYGGLLSVVLSLFLARYEPGIARGLQVSGVLAAACGVGLIWLRARMH